MYSITVGIPVYNEEKRLKDTMESLIKNYEDIERIIITDNCSTDATGEIARSYAQKYERIEYIRQKEKVPITTGNWMTSLRMATTKYFMWLGGHDRINEGYIRRLVRALEENATASVAVPLVYRFEDTYDEREVMVDYRNYAGIFSDNLLERIDEIFHMGSMECYFINQVFRKDLLKKMMKDYPVEWVHGDWIVAIHSLMLGKCVMDEGAEYDYWMRRSETTKQVRKRYENYFQIHIRKINPLAYVPREFVRLVKQYVDDEKAKTQLIRRIKFTNLYRQCCCYYDFMWIFYKFMWIFYTLIWGILHPCKFASKCKKKFVQIWSE